MTRGLGGLATLTALLVLSAATAGQPAPSAKPRASARPSASAAPAGSAALLPEGHPPVGDALPPGHPPTDVLPPDHPPTGKTELTPDQVLIDTTLPKGSIAIVIVDVDDKPLPSTAFTLTILKSSVARGDVTEHVERSTDAEGNARFDDLDVGTGISYTVTTSRGPATFRSQAFGLKDEAGIRVLLHVYEPVTSIAQTALVMEATLLIAIKDDSFAIDHRIRTLNMGRTAFVADGVSMRLPAGAFAFNTEEGMGDSGATMKERDGIATLTGTLPPGQGELFYRYQLPLAGDTTQTLELPVLPRVVLTTVLVGAGPKMGMSVDGFPRAQPDRGHDGQRVLRTARQPDLSAGLQGLLQDTRPGMVAVTISGIPTPGPWRWMALALATLLVGGSAWYLYGTGGRSRAAVAERREDMLEAQKTLLGELALLEIARRSGEVGPKSYERLRAALLDALARILARLEAEPAFVPAGAAAGAGGAGAATRKRARKKKKANPT